MAAERRVKPVRGSESATHRPGRRLLEVVVVLGEVHLRRLLRRYVDYHHHDRCHLSLEKDAPEGRSPSTRPSGDYAVVALPRVGGLHHRYEWRNAA